MERANWLAVLCKVVIELLSRLVCVLEEDLVKAVDLDQYQSQASRPYALCQPTN